MAEACGTCKAPIRNAHDGLGSEYWLHVSPDGMTEYVTCTGYNTVASPGPAPAVPHPETGEDSTCNNCHLHIRFMGAEWMHVSTTPGLRNHHQCMVYAEPLRSTSPQHDAPDLDDCLAGDMDRLYHELREHILGDAYCTPLLAVIKRLRASQPVHHDALTDEMIDSQANQPSLWTEPFADGARAYKLGAQWARDHAPVHHDADALANDCKRLSDEVRGGACSFAELNQGCCATQLVDVLNRAHNALRTKADAK